MIGVPLRLSSPQVCFFCPLPSSSLTLLVGPNTYRMCPSSPLPSLAKSFPPASALLMLQSLQHGSHSPCNFYLVAVYFASALQLMYEFACPLGLLLSLISPSLSSPQCRHLCSLSTIRLGSPLVASVLFSLTDGLPVFPSYISLGIRIGSFLLYIASQC